MKIIDSLCENEQHFRLLIENSTDIITVLNDYGIVFYQSTSIERFLGYNPEDILSTNFFQYIHPQDFPNVIKSFNTILQNPGIESTIEFRLQHQDGSWRYVESAINNLTFFSNFSGIVFNSRDITKRKLTEKALRESEERFSKSFKASPNPMAIFSLKNKRCIDANDSFIQNYGYSQEDISGITSLELLTLLSVDSGTAVKIKHKIMLRREIHNLEAKILTKTGQVREGLLSTEVITIKDEECLLVVINDITELKKMEKEMARLAPLHLVGEMAAGIAHEVRNPMTTVRGFLQMLREKKEFVQYKRHHDLMIEELDRANSIITEFLSLAKNKTENLKKQNLNFIIRALYPLISADAIIDDKYIEEELTDIPDLMLNENEIRQLILNFVRNGLDAMPKGKVLTIRTFSDDEEVVMSVQDEGKGIDPQVHDKIGTPFFTTKAQGTGLGLATCYSIASRHNARIDFKSDHAGTTFYVRFKL